MISSTRNRVTLAACLIISGMAALCWVRLQKTLIQKSVFVADVSGWWDEDMRLGTAYRWLSKDLLFSHSGWWRLQSPFVYDLKANARIPLTNLDRLIKNTGDMTESWDISPDGERIVWFINCEDEVHTAKLDGSEHRSWMAGGRGRDDRLTGVTWTVDSKSWIGSLYHFDTGAFAGSYSATVDTSRGAKANWLPVTMNGEAKAGDIEYIDGCKTYEIYTVNGSGGHWRPLIPPHSGSIMELLPDRENNRIAWIVRYERSAFWDRLRHAIRPTFSSKPQVEFALCVSRADGTHFQELGRVALSYKNPDAVPNSLQWRPGSAEVTFVYDGKLFAIDSSRALRD